ncbi:unnamed protein product [Cylindrotheca closterium]|uniref:Uncharacterized protein n=1 Tax=Cylindrotheca closterium TaxID=2856 RepID=A0AAD2G254_9STRA|nr:unnamed protein product [Cylindrotheca closterium]
MRVQNGELYGVEIFLFTDNSTAESVFYNGNSSSKRLFHLILRLRRVQQEADLILHLLHVSGKRMIAQGTDGGSRGDLNQGVMTGENMLSYVPLHLSAVDRSPSVLDWMRNIWEERLGKLEHLGIDDWFTKGHGRGNFLWTPPPAAADVVAEQVGEARHKHPESCHIAIVPHLGVCEEQSYWKHWSGNCALCGNAVKNGEGNFCGNFSFTRGNFPACRKVWCPKCYTVPAGSPYPIRTATDEDGFEVAMDGDEDRFRVSRVGDFLMTPFQCDICHFRNVMKRNPDICNEKHMLFMQDIRHANINANWSRESSTVKANFAQVKRLEKVGTDMFGIPSVTPVMGPFPLEDTFGMAIAACLLRRSLDPGRNENTIQFATARRFRSAFSNAVGEMGS